MAAAAGSGDGFLGMEDGAGRWQRLGADEAETDAGPLRRGPRSDEASGSAAFTEALGPPHGISASVQGDQILRTLLPLPLRVMVQLWPWLVGIALAANVIIIFILHQIWGQGHAYNMNVIDPGNREFCSKPYDWYRNGDVAILVPILALPEALRLRRFCLHGADNTFSAPLADLYSSVSLLTPESYQRTLVVNAGRCAIAMAASIVAYFVIALPIMLSSSLLHYPARLAHIKEPAKECGSDWWFGQVPDIFLVSIDMPIAALVFVPYFVVLHAAEGVRLALQAYAHDFEMKVSPANRDEAAMAETLKKHQALELLLDHAQLVLEPALRWLLLFGSALVLALLTWAWMEFSVANAHHSLGLFAVALVVTVLVLPLLRCVEKINAFQARLEKLAFSVGDPAALGSALPVTISQAAMLREYVREHALSLPVGGLVIRPDSLVSSSGIASAFGLVLVPYLVLVMPQFFGDAHFNSFKKMQQEQAAHHPQGNEKPPCVYCGRCAYHGICHDGYFTAPGYEGCSWKKHCQPVDYAADLLQNGRR